MLLSSAQERERARRLAEYKESDEHRQAVAALQEGLQELDDLIAEEHGEDSRKLPRRAKGILWVHTGSCGAMVSAAFRRPHRL